MLKSPRPTLLVVLVALFAAGCAASSLRQAQDGGDGDDDAAPPDAATAYCGNGLLDGDDECDDGNLLDGDGCGPQCTVEPGWSCAGEPSACTNLCGDGHLDPGEECDGASLGGATCNTVPGGYSGGDLACSGSCRYDTTACILPGCGNGTVDGSEECDDGNTANTDACLNNCQNAACGDGHTWAGEEECDDGNTANTDACLNLCTTARCGDGHVHIGQEGCDDGNTADTDGCLSTCVPAACGDGILWVGQEECDDANLGEGDGCDSQCADEHLPVIHSLSSLSGGWSTHTITWAGQPLAPITPIVAAANVEQLGQAWLFTASTYHVMEVPGFTFVEAGNLTTKFSGFDPTGLNGAYGVSRTDDTDLVFGCGPTAYIFTLDHTSGVLTPHVDNPIPNPWNDPYAPDPNDVQALWLDFTNAQGWAFGNPNTICPPSETTVGPNVPVLTTAGNVHISDQGYCFQFVATQGAATYPPLGLSTAPPWQDIQAVFYFTDTGTIYAIAQ